MNDQNDDYYSIIAAILDVEGDATKRRATVALAIKDHVTHTGLTPNQAARLFDIRPEQMADLLAGRIVDFSLKDLVGMARRGGIIPTERIVLPEADYLAFVAALDAPPESNPGLQRLMEVETPTGRRDE